jgi:hypothetical protein
MSLRRFGYKNGLHPLRSIGERTDRFLEKQSISFPDREVHGSKRHNRRSQSYAQECAFADSNDCLD